MPTEPATTQPCLPAMFDIHRKYAKDTKDAKRLNKAVAEFICLDQVPTYTVKKSGFWSFVQQLDRKYDIIMRNYLMYNETPKLYTETQNIVLLILLTFEQAGQLVHAWQSVSSILRNPGKQS